MDWLVRWWRKADLAQRLIVIACVLIVVGLAAAAMHDVQHPCLKYGEQRVMYYQKIGSMIYPVYGADCLERKP